MGKKKTNDPKVLIIAKRVAFFAFVVAILGNIVFNSLEMDINAKTKKRQDEISAIQSDIDGLEIQKSELASFCRLKKVATAKGYTYKQGSTAAVVVSEDK